MSEGAFPEDILDATLKQFIAATAAKSPTPGGGSVAALAGALAAALAEMALQYTVGKKQFAAHQEELLGTIERLRKAAGLMQEMVHEDIEAYQALAAALKIPGEQRAENREYLTAVVAAIRAPEAVGGMALYILEICAGMLGKCNPFLLSDLGAAGALAYATVQVAELNVLANMKLLPNQAEAAELKKRTLETSLKAEVLWHKVRDHLRATV